MTDETAIPDAVTEEDEGDEEVGEVVEVPGDETEEDVEEEEGTKDGEVPADAL